MHVLKRISILAAIVVIGGFGLWWVGRRPNRPTSLPANAVYLESGVVPFKLRSTPGTWVGCWYELADQADRCRLTDENGKIEYEDIFLPYDGRAPVPESALIFDSHLTGLQWTGSYEKRIRVPVIYLTNGRILLPRAIFEDAKRKVEPFIDAPTQ